MPEAAAESQRDYSWAEYLDCMEGGASDVLTLPQARPAPSSVPRADQPVFGLSLAALLTIAAIYLSELPMWPFTLAGGRHPIEPVMLAILLGMLVSNFWQLPKSFQAGIKFSVKKVLPVGIVLLGARLDFIAVMKVGSAAVLMSVVETVVALCLLLWLAKRFGLARKLGILLGVGTAICGGTAIVATAPVIDAEEKDVVFSVATVTLLGLLAMFSLPILGHLLELSDKAFGVWAGLAIHQTPQVVAAGYAYNPGHPEAGDTATIVKLARVCLLAPVVFVIGLLYAREQLKQNEVFGRRRINYLHLFPMFVLGFLAMALMRTLGLIPDITLHLSNGAIFTAADQKLSLSGVFDQVSRLCIILSMAAVGLETRFSSMKQTGLKPFVASLLAVIVIAILILAMIKGAGF